MAGVAYIVSSASRLNSKLGVLRMILFGLTGSGVSSTGNTILGEHRFSTGTSFEAVTKECERGTKIRFGKPVSVVDTPGFPVEMNEKEIKELLDNLYDGAKMLPPGPNVFILVSCIDRFTEGNKFLIRCLRQINGISKFVINVFCRVDQVNQPIPAIEQKIRDSENLRDALKLSSGRFVLFDNTSHDDKQVRKILEMSEQLVKQNLYKYIPGSMFGRETAIQLIEINREQQAIWNSIYTYIFPQSLWDKYCTIL